MSVTINGTTGITDVNGSSTAPAITGTDTDTGLYFGTNTLGLSTNGTNAVYVDSSQNVGIGTTSPGTRTLAVVSSTDKGTIGVFSGASYGVRIGTIASTGGVIEGVDVTGSASYQPLIVGGSQVQFTTSGTERMRITSNGGVSFGSSGTAYGTSGQVLQSNGDAAPTWVAAGMTLLGTITPTAVNSLSLGSLTLTSYKSLFIEFNNIGESALAQLYINSTNGQTGGGINVNTTATGLYGVAWIGLIGGGLTGSLSSDQANTSAGGGPTSITTSSTTIYFRWAGTKTFTATGSITVYGVK